ncbi:MAG: protein tyrosine phosphatase family protein [Acidimicrobiales bacterium]|nr:protein tyrosine phosphatase family protein [Acidimicrobiales bacterium]
MSIEASTNFRRVDERVTTSGAVDAERLAALRSEGYDVVINLMPDDSPHAVAGEADIVTGQGVEYIAIPVDFATPGREDLEAFFAAMDANAGRQVHVHCAVNARVSAFYSLYAMRQGRWSAEESDAHITGIWDPAEYPAWQAFIAEERARLAS